MSVFYIFIEKIFSLNAAYSITFSSYLVCTQKFILIINSKNLKTMKISLKWTLLLVLGVIGLTTFISCDDDDDNKGPVLPKLTDVYGEYSGKATFVIANEDQPAPQAANEETNKIDIDVTVNNDTIYFKEFPTGALIDAILGAGNGEAIKGKLGKVSYEIPYTGAFNAAQDTISMTLTPEPLNLEVVLAEGSDPLKVKVTIVSEDKGTYSIEKKNLKFNMEVSNIDVENVPMEKTISFSFDMNKK